MGRRNKKGKKKGQQPRAVPTLGMEGKNKNLPVVPKQHKGAPVPAQGTLAFIKQQNGIGQENEKQEKEKKPSNKRNKKRHRKRTKNNKYRVPEASRKATLKKEKSEENNEQNDLSESNIENLQQQQQLLSSSDQEEEHVVSKKRTRKEAELDSEPVDYVEFGEVVKEPPPLKGIVGGRGAHDIVGPYQQEDNNSIDDSEEEEKDEMEQLREAVMRRYRMQRERSRQRQQKMGKTGLVHGTGNKRQRTVGTYKAGFNINGWEG